MLGAQIQSVREALRRFNRQAGVLKADPYGLGLSLSQGSALVDLDRHGTLRPNDLARLLNLEKSSVSRLLTVLQRAGLIEISPDPRDGRSKLLRLTRRGQRAARTVNRLADEAVERAMRGLAPRDREGVARAFGLLGRALAEEREAAAAAP